MLNASCYKLALLDPFLIDKRFLQPQDLEMISMHIKSCNDKCMDPTAVKILSTFNYSCYRHCYVCFSQLLHLCLYTTRYFQAKHLFVFSYKKLSRNIIIILLL